jgi:Glyoxalase-like domain
MRYFDHVFGFARDDATSVAAGLRAAGFTCLDEDVLGHGAGKRAAFVYLSGSYLEIATVADPVRFAREATAAERDGHAHLRPYGVVLATDELAEIQLGLAGHGEPAQLEHHTAEGACAPDWAVVRIAPHLLPGVSGVALAYLNRRQGRCRLRAGANTIFGVGGFVLCSAGVAADHARWSATLAPLVPVTHGPDELVLGVQRISWTTPDDFARAWRRPWPMAAAGIAAVRVYCTDLGAADGHLVRGGFTVPHRTATVLHAYHAALGQWLIVEPRDPAPFLAFVDRQRGW